MADVITIDILVLSNSAMLSLVRVYGLRFDA